MPDPDPMTAANRRFLIAGAVVVALVAGGIAAYFSTDSGAREGRKAGKAPPAVPVTVAFVAQETVPIELRAIGNVEAYSTVALKARVDGQIVEVNFREGQPVRKGAVLFRIDPRPYEAALRQAEANALRDAAARDQARSQEKRYQELLDKNFISKEAYAQIRTNAATAEATASAGDPTTGTIRLRAQFDNVDAALWPGQFVNVSVRLYEQVDAIVIPSPAVQNGPQGQYVYVVGPDLVADVRKITVLRTDGERTIVATGLQKGERVVTRGQLRLGSKTRVQVGKPAAEAS